MAINLLLKSTEASLAAGALQDNTAQAYRTWPAEGGKFRLAHFTLPALAAQSDIGSLIRLCKLSVGRVRILPQRSQFVCSAWGAGCTLDFGIDSYIASDGKTVIAAAPTDIVAAKDVSGALTVLTNIGVAGVKKDYFTARHLYVYATVGGANAPAGATLEGFIAYEIVG